MRSNPQWRPTSSMRIRLAADVHPEGRHLDLPALGRIRQLEAELGEEPHDVLIRDRIAEEPRQPGAPERDAPCRCRARIDVRHGARRLAGPGVLQQRERALDRADRRGEVGSALEPRGGFGLEAEALAGRAHGRRLKPGALERDAFGRGRDLRVPAAHHAGQRHGAFAIGDDQHRVVERARLPVERRELLARARAAHADLRPAELLDVERVHRMAHLEHHVVGDVDDVVDGPDADGREPRREPGGRRPDADIRARQRVAATAGVADRDGHGRRPGRRDRLAVARRRLERDVERGRGLPRQAVHAQGVRTIGGDLDVDDLAVDRRHFEPARPEARRDFRRRARHVGEFLQPGERDLHSATWPRKRTSFS